MKIKYNDWLIALLTTKYSFYNSYTFMTDMSQCSSSFGFVLLYECSENTSENSINKITDSNNTGLRKITWRLMAETRLRKRMDRIPSLPPRGKARGDDRTQKKWKCIMTILRDIPLRYCHHYHYQATFKNKPKIPLH